MAHPIWSLFYGIIGMAGGSYSDFEVTVHTLKQLNDITWLK